MEVYSERIQVQCEGEPSRPVSFKWRKKEYQIEEILKSWQDWGFPGGSPPRKNWRLRRHRTYYKVRAESTRFFEIYMDRKKPEPIWVIYRELKTQEPD